MRDANYNETIEFLSEFFRDTSEAVELRALPNGAGAPKVEFTRNPLRVIAFCQHYDGVGWGIFFGVATREEGGRGGSREYCRELPALWTEIDIHKFGVTVEDAVGILRGCALPPSLIVSSGRGLHVYWMLSSPYPVTWAPMGEDAEKARVEVITRGLARIFHGDLNACDLTRILRLVGTHNTKEGDLKPCRILEASWTRYGLEQVEEFAALSPVSMIGVPAAQTSDLPSSRPTGELEGDPYAAYGFNWREPFDLAKLDRMVWKDRELPIHDTRLRAIAKLVESGIPDEEIFAQTLAATERAVAAAPATPEVVRERAHWNWKAEEALIRREIRGAHALPPLSGKVVQMRSREQAEPKTAEPAPEFMGYPLNDLGNALRLLKQHAPVMRYVLNIGWHIWDKRRFAYDQESSVARGLAHQTVKDILTQAFEAQSASAKSRAAIIKFALQCGNSGRLANMLHEAEPHIAHPAEALDADPWLLNCRNGTVDLRSGELRPHAQADLITKIAGSRYEVDAACPKWEKFLLEIFGGDPAKSIEENAGALDMVGFLQRSIGYSLTGLTTEQVLFIMYGTGANGKSVLIETITAVMGEYVRHSPAETWVSKPAGSSSNDIAALVGARFVSVIETEQDRHLAEALVKQATGGDMITARFHYKEFFSYVPQFKLWFATNHRPKIRGSDYAIWRRIMLLPFTVKFVDGTVAAGQKVRDPDLKKNLKAEYPGILAWMVRGCLEWQRIGLQPPALVKDAVEAYQDREDNVSGFLRDCCGFSHGLTCGSGLLYAGYQVWCEEESEEALVKGAFLRNLDDRGFPAGKRTMKERLRSGLDLNEEYQNKAASWVAPSAAPTPTV